MEKPQNTTATEFVPPRHWVGPEELNASYWADPAIKEKRGQEFFEKPIEMIAGIDQADKAGIARRDFLTIMGASMAMATFACARKPVNKIIPYVVKPEEVVPGNPLFYASTLNDGKESFGILVKTREGRPIKLEGNPDHPINAGKLSAQAQAALLDLYDMDRLKTPVSRTRGGAAKEISWSDADQAVVSKLRSAGAGKVRVLSGANFSETSGKLVKEFLAAHGSPEATEYEALALDEVRDGQERSYGTAVLPYYHFDEAHVVVAFGSDFLNTGSNPLENQILWAKNRKLDSKNPRGSKFGKLITVESTMTLTGANSDERMPVRAGDELKVALAVANALIGKTRYAGDSAVTAALAGYTPDAVAAEIGTDAKKIHDIANDLLAARGKGIVIAGGIHSKTKDAVALQVVVNLLNSALENEGATIDGTANALARREGTTALNKLIAEMKAGQVDVLIINGTNPVFTYPQGVSGIEDAMKKVPFIVVVADRDNETAQQADLVLPVHHALENWGDATARKGVTSLQQPAIAPIHSSRAFQDNLIAWSKALGHNTAAARAMDWHTYLQNRWKEILGATNFDRNWEKTLEKGMHVTATAGRASARSFRSAALSVVPKYAAADKNAIFLALYENTAIADGRYANNPWLQELPDPISSVTWDNYIAVSPALAAKLSVKTDDVVEVTAGDVKAELPVYVQPGLHAASVAIAVGYGRRNAGKVGNGTGVNVYPFVKNVDGQAVFSGHPVTLRKTGRFYRLATTQWHTVSENRPIINDITFDEFKKNPSSANHTDPHLKMDQVPTIWPTFDYKGNRWGMAIDLSACTGCSACSIACVAENNIPVVGREQVRNSRQMHWIRIDRYYSGSPENPDVVFQPMLCQHCENAPCETVCPVLATVHDDEGINTQVYNRCVGTRYCQNNCPYKVRRFNFFDHWKSYEGTANLVWNPDVTVRSRGIMEKCTFCIQRIVEAKDKVKDEGTGIPGRDGKKKMVPDGTFKTACQQTCPTDAIVFGNINDPKSRVSQLAADARAFRVLEILNTRPSISYLTKVRNKEEGASHGHH